MRLSARRASSALVLSLALLMAVAGTGAAAASASVASVASVAGSAPNPASQNVAGPPVDTFHGVNWADTRDNFNAGPVVPSGLSTSDSYQDVYATTLRMVTGFRDNLGANMIRLPVNPASVDTAWWQSYRAAIDAATASGDRVILSYWDQRSSSDGVIDDVGAWNQMWDTLTTVYGHNPKVYFEPMNEPYGYTADQWVQIAATWLADHSAIARDRVMISGTGYNDHLDAVGGVPALDGTLLSLHFYGFWANYTTESNWTADLLPRIGPYASRTVIDEDGAPMTTGLNYGAHNGNVYTAYFASVTDNARSMHMGTVYWPGLRFNDSYSMESLDSSGNLVDNNASGVAQLKWGYGFDEPDPANDLPPAPAGQ